MKIKTSVKKHSFLECIKNMIQLYSVYKRHTLDSKTQIVKN